MSILITTVVLLFHSSPYVPFVFQFLLISFLLLFASPSKENSVQSSQFEIWAFFFIATLLPFILYSASSFSVFASNPLLYLLYCIALFFTPGSIFLGLLSIRFYPWMSTTPTPLEL